MRSATQQILHVGVCVDVSVLISTLGAEPQVVTLTLDALLHRGERISRLYVVHTDASIPPIKGAKSKLDEIFVGSNRYPMLLYVPHLLSGPQDALRDVATADEILLAYQSLYRLLRQQKQAGCRVHLCLAGGRKTMTSFALAAAQVVLSTQDRVWHLISPPPLIASQTMHAPHPSDVQLVSVPLLHPGKLQTEDGARKATAFLTLLTPAERELATLLVREGLSNDLLADRLGKSTKTVANQLSSIYSKLRDHYLLEEAPDRTSLMAFIGRYS